MTYNVETPLDQDIDLDADPEQELDSIIVALRKERLAQEKTQWDVAKQMGYSAPSYVSNLEQGQHDLTLSTLRSWAAALGLEVLIRAPKSNRGRPRTNFR